MSQTSTTSKNSIHCHAQRVYNAIGFTRSYNFFLWLIFSGALFGFLLARAAYLNFNNIFCSKTRIPNLDAAPGECLVYFSRRVYLIGIQLHLYTIIPAGIFALFQFVPIIRHKLMIFHRINGYLVIVLVLFSHVGALMIARMAMGGSLSTQLWIGFVAIATTTSLFLAWYNIKRLQIDQHRKWMLRSWFYLASILTERLIQMAAVTILSKIGSYFIAMPCNKVLPLMTSYGLPPQVGHKLYPSCLPSANGTIPTRQVGVKIDKNGTPEQVAAAYNITFGMSLWLALVLHAIGIEIYIRLTPGESDRLRQISYERQIKAGMQTSSHEDQVSDSVTRSPKEDSQNQQDSTTH